MHELLQNVRVVEDVPNRWVWKGALAGKPTVKEIYEELWKRKNSMAHVQEIKGSFVLLWRTFAIYKAQSTAWRLLWNKLPTKDNLSKRMVLDTEVSV